MSTVEVIEMPIYPRLRSLPPQRADLPGEPAISVEFARGTKPTHYIVSANGMNEHALCIALAQFSVIDQLCHESDGSHFSHK
jgi:hypothetical protein